MNEPSSARKVSTAHIMLLLTIRKKPLGTKGIAISKKGITTRTLGAFLLLVTRSRSILKIGHRDTKEVAKSTGHTDFAVGDCGMFGATLDPGGGTGGSLAIPSAPCPMACSVPPLPIAASDFLPSTDTRLKTSPSLSLSPSLSGSVMRCYKRSVDRF